MKITTKSNEYVSIHQWLRYHYGKASECTNPDCKHTSPKRFEWALRKGKRYARKVENFIPLCASCHRKYDFNEQVRRNILKSCYMSKKTHCAKGHLLSGENMKIRLTRGKETRTCDICVKASAKRMRIKYKLKINSNN